MPAYYNEIDPYAAQWLRNLIAAGHIAPGDVDERSILEVKPDDLKGYTQCHFFAGIGGWSYAMRLAGWADSRPVWTGSCPCQPFSTAGKQRGSDDERHLWPAFFCLIAECRPAIVFGEQVAGAAGLAWWDHVAADLEGDSYAAAAAVVGAHSVGAPHHRQRLYWVADAKLQRLEGFEEEGAKERPAFGSGGGCACLGEGVRDRRGILVQPAPKGSVGMRVSPDRGLDGGPIQPNPEWMGTESEPFPLAYGIPNRVGRLRAYGNAIVPQVAAAFVMAAMEPT
jgi:DNA (cytosine-5)-methyltransferase 1